MSYDERRLSTYRRRWRWPRVNEKIVSCERLRVAEKAMNHGIFPSTGKVTFPFT